MALESLPWSHGEFAMEGFNSVWGRHQDAFPQNVDELKQKLLYATWELETFQAAAKEEIRKKDETINKLINLLNLTRKERDEAKQQLNSVLSCLQPKTPQQTGAVNSGLTESDSLSETHTRNNHQSYVSSPVESFHHADSSNITNASSYDYGSIIIDELAKHRQLPEKGKLMEAVMNAGPLLQTLMVAGPLPTWRNPPPFQAFQPTRFSLQGSSPTIQGPSPTIRYPFNLVNELGYRVKKPAASGLDSISDGHGTKRLKNA